MHTTLALVGMSWLSRASGPDPEMRQEVLHQKGLAIKTVNSLLDHPSVSKILMAGVASLADIAVSMPPFSPSLCQGLFDPADEAPIMSPLSLPHMLYLPRN